MTDYGYRKVCAFCGETFFSQYRTKKTCSFACTKRHEASLHRVRDKRRRNKKRILMGATRDLGEPHEQA